MNQTILWAVVAGMLALLAPFSGGGSEVTVQNEKLALTFADPAQGAGLLKIVNRDAGQEFWANAASRPLLWTICFARAGTPDEGHLWVSNTAASTCTAELRDGKLQIEWRNLSIGEIPDAFSVRLSVEPDAEGRMELRLEPELHTDLYTFRDLLFPCREQVLDPATEEVLFPRGNIGSRLVDGPISGSYPGCESQLQFFGWFKKAAPGGIYMGLHDPDAAAKFFSLGDQMNLDIVTYAAGMLTPGESHFPAYPVVIAAIDTPWDACAQYRQWALRQRWCAKGKLADRGDIPPAAREIDLWFNLFGDPTDVEKRFLAEAANIDANIAVHWYSWNVPAFDTRYPDFFPAKEHFDSAVQAIQAPGNFVVPYINGRLWDVALPDFESAGRSGVSLRADGTPTIEDYGSGATLAAMCPTSPAYQAKIRQALKTLIDTDRVNGVYIDQIGAASPVLCFSTKHGHPVGGGGWWQEAYRQMLAPIVDEYGSRVLLATENGAEPYMDTISSFLLWMAVYPDDFPSLAAVYNQHAWYFCSPASADDNRNEFCALMSRSLMWGIQPGWLPWLHNGLDMEKYRWEKEYVQQIVALRKQAKSTLVEGVLVDEAHFRTPVGDMPVEFKRNAQYGGTSTPGRHVDLQGALWRSDDAQEWSFAIAELAGKARSVEFAVDLATYGVDPAGKELVRIHPDGREELQHPEDGILRTEIGAHDLQVFTWKPTR